MRSIPSVENANATPALARAAAVPTCSFHLALRWASTRSGSSRSAAGLLAVFFLGGNLGLLREVEPQHDRDLGRLEPVGDLGGLAAADDHGGRAELLGQIERAVDLVAACWLPTRPAASSTGRPGGPSSAGSNGRLAAAVRLVERIELLEVVGVEHRLAEVGDRAHQDARIRVFAGPSCPKRPGGAGSDRARASGPASARRRRGAGSGLPRRRRAAAAASDGGAG